MGGEEREGKEEEDGLLVDWGAVTPFDSSFGQQKGLIWAWVMRMLAFSSLSSSFSLWLGW